MRQHILSACSNPLLLYTRGTILEQAGFQVSGASSRDEVFMLLEQHQFALVLLGDAPDSGSKFDLARGLRHSAPNLPVVVICTDAQDMEKCYREGFPAIEGLEGPEALLCAIENVLRGRNAGARAGDVPPRFPCQSVPGPQPHQHAVRLPGRLHIR
jgi:DNA-binding response OmpR family regulator